MLPDSIEIALWCLICQLAWLLPLVACVRYRYITPTRRMIDWSLFAVGTLCAICWVAAVWANWRGPVQTGFEILFSAFPLAGCAYADVIFFLRGSVHWREFAQKRANP
jgi:hypothetical protein